jgi:hypothetical protein
MNVTEKFAMLLVEHSGKAVRAKRLLETTNILEMYFHERIVEFMQEHHPEQLRPEHVKAD